MKNSDVFKRLMRFVKPYAGYLVVALLCAVIYVVMSLLCPVLVGRAVEQVLAANPKSIEDYRAGKEKAFGFLVGQVMRELKGRASPQVVNQTIREKLEQMK